MTPVVADLLDRAGLHLDEARGLLADGYERLAAREAYQAMFHAAQAAMVAAEGAVPKTHKGLITRFAAVARAEPRLGGALGRALARGYRVKEVADYGSLGEIRQLNGSASVAQAEGFVASVRTLLDAAPDR